MRAPPRPGARDRDAPGPAATYLLAQSGAFSGRLFPFPDEAATRGRPTPLTTPSPSLHLLPTPPPESAPSTKFGTSRLRPIEYDAHVRALLQALVDRFDWEPIMEQSNIIARRRTASR